MNVNKKLIYGLMAVVAIVIAVLISISSFIFLSNSLGNSVANRIVSGTGTIVHDTIGEFTFYAIMPDKGTPIWQGGLYLPVKVLPEDFAEDGLRVRFKVELVSSYFMPYKSAVMVEILELEKLG